MKAKRTPLLVSWLAVGLVVVIGLAVGIFGGEPPTPAERVRNLSGQIACPVCDGQSVRESDAGIAIEIRAEIQRRVQAGQTDHEILGFLENSYPGNLLTPSATGTSSLVWALPVTLAVLALAGLGVAFLQWQPKAEVKVEPADYALVDQALQQRQTNRSLEP